MGRGEVAREAPVEADLQGCAGSPARGDRAVRVGEGHRHRLLDEDGLAGLGRRDDEVRVGGARARDGDGLDPRVVDECLRVGQPVDPERGAETFGGRRLDVGDGDELGLAEASRQGGGVVGPDAAGSDETEADGVGARHDCSFADED